jgi:c-di-GMP-binding flagellar brake protein YcgR
MTQDKEDFLIKKPSEIRSLLRNLVESHQLVSVSPEHLEICSISVINEVCSDGQSFLLDSVRDTVVDKRINEGSVFSIITAFNGIEVRIENLKSSSVVRSGDLVNYKIDLPSQIYYLQRRGTFRAPVPVMMGISVSIGHNPDDKNSAIRDLTIENAQLIDISVSGCALLLRAEDATDLTNCNSPLTLHVKVAETNETIVLEALVRHNREIKRSSTCRVGCEFVDLTPAAINRIEQLNAMFQLSARRKRA